MHQEYRRQWYLLARARLSVRRELAVTLFVWIAIITGSSTAMLEVRTAEAVLWSLDMALGCLR